MRRILCLPIAVAAVLATSASAQNRLYDFGSNGSVSCWQQASDGNLYSQGLMFNMTTLAAPSTFPLPSCNFIQGTDTNFYSWTGNIIDQVTLAGVVTVVHTLTETDGGTVTAVIQGNDGNFYGTSSYGGAYGYGTLFTFTSAGSFTKLYDSTDGTDGEQPATLVQASDGNLYGSTTTTVFKSTLAGDLVTIATTGAPTAQLLEGSGGLLYGNFGEIESVSLGGAVTEVATALSLSLTSIGSPCYMDGRGTLYCSTEYNDNNEIFRTALVYIPPSGEGGLGYVFDAADVASGDEGASYSFAGNGSFFGVDSWSGYTNFGCQPNCYVSDTFLYQLSSGGAAPIDIVPTYSTSSLNPGQPFTLTWTVNAWSDTAQYCFASGAWSGVKIGSGSATINAPSTPGTYRYALTCGGTETNSVTIPVGLPTITFSANPNTFVVGTPVTLTAQVTGQTGVIPTGKVNFLAGSIVIGSATLNGSGIATLTFPTTGVAPGGYTIEAQYVGSSTYAAVTSATTSVIVLASRFPTVSQIDAPSPSTIRRGQSVTLTGTVQYSGSYAPGTVTFSTEGQILGTVNQTDGASLTISTADAPLGTYPVVMSYAGNSVYAPSTSSPTNITIVGNAPSMTATANPATVTPPATVIVTATVGGVSGEPVPTGTVSFYYSTMLLGKGTLNGSGVATFSQATTGLAAGIYDITANYSGDNNYVADSATVAVTVQ